jgi:hypothetical protein
VTEGPEPPSSGTIEPRSEVAAEPGPAAELAPAPSPETESAPSTELAPAIEPGAAPGIPTATSDIPSVESTRRLLGASFDLLTRTPDDMRRASFYIGVIVLGTVGPFALASWGIEVLAFRETDREFREMLRSPGFAWYAALGWLAGSGIVVAAVESRTMAVAVLGGGFARRPVTVREALARSRTVFWRAVLASVIVGVPLFVGGAILSAIFESLVGPEVDMSIVSSALGAIVIGAPFAYLLTGIVLGDVEPFEAARRSFRVFRARKVAAALVALFETIAVLLVLFGVSAGLDIAQRIFHALGLGAGSGPAGLAVVTVGVIVGVFALGTLVYTALAISVAPQVVMFVGLTHATIGLDHVRPGGDRDPATRVPGRARFRWLTRPMLLGFAFGAIGLAAALALLMS